VLLSQPRDLLENPACRFLVRPNQFHHFPRLSEEMHLHLPFSIPLRMEMRGFVIKRPEPQFQTSDCKRSYRCHSILPSCRTLGKTRLTQMSDVSFFAGFLC